MKTVFQVGVEVSQMAGSQLPADCKGAFVNVFVGSTDIKKAINTVECSLLEDCYKPINTYEAFEVNLEEYSQSKEGYPMLADLQDIQNNSEVWYGPFYTYPYEELESSD